MLIILFFFIIILPPSIPPVGSCWLGGPLTPCFLWRSWWRTHHNSVEPQHCALGLEVCEYIRWRGVWGEGLQIITDLTVVNTSEKIAR